MSGFTPTIKRSAIKAALENAYLVTHGHIVCAAYDVVTTRTGCVRLGEAEDYAEKALRDEESLWGTDYLLPDTAPLKTYRYRPSIKVWVATAAGIDSYGVAYGVGDYVSEDNGNTLAFGKSYFEEIFEEATE